ncbi:MAG: hypothetical protein EKK48_22265 [Candidatus Melainabacteria bacterium]|nr:MAG: hypothetical protein EKK48_22265 [Candidatus Melainabacteria bacterium]
MVTCFTITTYQKVNNMNTLMSPQASLAVGIALMVLGVSFFYKAVVAIINGRMPYWTGFLPLTIISPLLIHLPGSKNSLIKFTEGMWVMAVMAPVFLVLSVLCLLSGAEYAGLPAVEQVNSALHGGTDGTAVIAFSKTRGFAFPLLAHSSPALKRVFGSSINLDPKQELVPRNSESYQQQIDNK